MKKLFFVLMFFSYSVFAQNTTIYLIGGINYNLISSNVFQAYRSVPNPNRPITPDFHYPDKASTFTKTTGKLGGQLGVGIEKKFSNNILVGAFTAIEERSSFKENAYAVRDPAGGLVGWVHLGIRSVVVNPGINVGFSPLKNLTFGSGVSLPVNLISFSKAYPNKKEPPGDVHELNGRFKSGSKMGINIPVFVRYNIGNKSFLQVNYFIGITNRLAGSEKELDNLFSLNFGMKIN